MELEEKEFYKDSDVLVTQSRFVCYGKTYAMRNISSVSVATIQGDYSVPIIILLFVFLLVGFANSSVFGFGVLILLIAYLYFGKADDKFVIKINSNSGEVNALQSLKKGYILEVEKALNSAIIYRG